MQNTGGVERGYSANANALIGNTVYFSAPGASNSTVTKIPVILAVSGTVGTNPAYSPCPGCASGGFSAIVGGQGGILNAQVPYTSGNVTQSFSYSNTFYAPMNTQSGKISEVIFGDIEFQGSAAIVGLLVDLSAGGQYGYADFGDTASLSFGALPQGVSFTAASGLTPAPLPAALPLFAAGLGAMSLFGWRRKRKAAARPAVG